MFVEKRRLRKNHRLLGAWLCALLLLSACGTQRLDLSKARKSGPSSSDERRSDDSTRPPDSQPPSNEEPSPSPTPPLAKMNFLIGTIGDSISRGFNAGAVGSEGGRFNWSTGELLDGADASHLHRLRYLADEVDRDVTVTAHSEAVVGAEIIDENQPSVAQQAAQMSQRRPDYVTILMGSNDICQTSLRGSDLRTVARQRVTTALRTLTEGSSPPKLILLASSPNPRALKAVNTESEFSFGGLKCLAAWEFYCPNMQDLPSSTFDELWREVNFALQEAAEAVGPPVVFDNFVVANFTYRREHVSDIDCFHPSRHGQREMAGKLWEVVKARLTTIFKTP